MPHDLQALLDLLAGHPRPGRRPPQAMTQRGRRARNFVLVLGLFALVFFSVAPGVVERIMNGVAVSPPYPIPADLARFHRTLTVVDLHSDPLLWGRDLTVPGSRGHIDIPRLIEGGVAVQGFFLVTRTPRGLNIEKNDDSTDNITLLALAQRWPTRCFSSLKERALYQAGRLHDMAARSGGRFVVIHSVTELDRFLEQRKKDSGIVAGFLGVEGAHALDGDLSNLDALFAAGVRVMALTHFFDNDLGGSAAGVAKGGLTEKGKKLVREMEARHMVVDLAHASSRTVSDILDLATRPVMVSHTGVKGTCDNQRNITDAELERVAATGGVVGIGFWETATCGEDAAAIARAIRHAADIAGAGHVGLGSDFDGAIRAPFDATGMPLVTGALKSAGFTDEEIAGIMGGNALRVLRAGLPP